MYRFFGCLFFSFFTVISQAQDSQKEISKESATLVLQKVSDFYNQTTEYTVQTKVLSFEDYISKTPSDSSLGYYSKKGNCISSLSLGLKTMQDEFIKIIVDTAQKIILLSSPEMSYNTSAEQLKYSIDKSTKITTTSSNSKEYFLFYYPEGTEYAMVKMLIEPNGFISEYFIFYSIQDYTLEEYKVIKPRAEVYFYNFKQNAKKNMCDLSEYIQKKDSKIYLSSAYQTYQLLDTRFKE